jgi:hypothetical protein
VDAVTITLEAEEGADQPTSAALVSATVRAGR